MDIYLIRHGAIKVEAGVCYGRLDLSLTDAFREEAESLKAFLPDNPDRIVYSSPLSRCMILANLLSNGPVKEDDRLLEYPFGHWEGLKWDDIDKTEFDSWHESYIDRPGPGGESYRDLYQRAAAFMAEISSQSADTVLVLTHTGVIRAILCEILSIPLDKSFRIRVDYASATKITWTQSPPQVEYINRIA
ncbi:MAG: alpha-ribazole phosphatase [Spirochaetota bacterium]|nr:alpha-ribazole phosphatase [Spirochaetota bacterium]